MNNIGETNETQANVLCKSCGLCCTGHLFTWTKLKSSELDSAEALGLYVFRFPTSQRGFNQPCPLWQGVCTIYASAHYPHFCRTYKCKLLKQVLDETTSLSHAETVVQQAKGLIRELEALLPDSPNSSFRERLVTHLEALERVEPSTEQDYQNVEYRLKARALVVLYENIFGVKDLIDQPDGG